MGPPGWGDFTRTLAQSITRWVLFYPNLFNLALCIFSAHQASIAELFSGIQRLTAASGLSRAFLLGGRGGGVVGGIHPQWLSTRLTAWHAFFLNFFKATSFCPLFQTEYLPWLLKKQVCFLFIPFIYCMYLCLNVKMYKCMNVYMQIYMNITMHTYINIRTYIFINTYMHAIFCW